MKVEKLLQLEIYVTASLVLKFFFKKKKKQERSEKCRLLLKL